MPFLTRFSFQQVFTFIGGDMTDGGKDVGAMSSTTFDTVPVIDSSFSRLGIHVEMLQIVVEIHRASAEIPAQQSSVGSEDSGDIQAPFLDQRNCHTSLPFMEMSNNSRIGWFRILKNGISSSPFRFLFFTFYCLPLVQEPPRTMLSSSQAR